MCYAWYFKRYIRHWQTNIFLEVERQIKLVKKYKYFGEGQKINNFFEFLIFNTLFNYVKHTSFRFDIILRMIDYKDIVTNINDIILKYWRY